MGQTVFIARADLAEQTAQQGHQSDTDEGNAAASHQLLHALTLGTGVIRTITFQQILLRPKRRDRAARSHHQSLQNVNCTVKEFHEQKSPL